MKEGYLIVRCVRCGSRSQLPLKSVRSEVSQCPVCQDGEIECKAIQPSIQPCKELAENVTSLSPYVTTLMKLSSN